MTPPLPQAHPGLRLDLLFECDVPGGPFLLVYYSDETISTVGVLATGTVWGGVPDVFFFGFNRRLFYVFLHRTNLF
jgi:hypothetical protein